MEIWLWVIPLTAQRCRQLIGQDCQLSDEEIEAIRSSLFELTQSIVKEFIASKKKSGLGDQRDASVIGKTEGALHQLSESVNEVAS